MSRAWSRRRAARYGVVLLACLSAAALPLRADELDDEFNFASGLIDLGFQDFADQIVNEILEKHPDQKGRAMIVRVQGLVTARKFDDAEKLIAGLPTGPGKDDIWLELGKGYYRVGETVKARKIFDDYFARFKEAPKDPAKLKSYAEAAYMVSQMLQNGGDLPGSLTYLERVIASKPEKGLACALMVEAANVLIDMARKDPAKKTELLAKAEKYAKDATWAGPGVTLGKAVVSLADVALMRGDRAAALKLINDDYKTMLREIDEILKAQNALDESPVARVRYMKGEMLEQDAQGVKDPKAKAKKLVEALTEYANVMVKYGGSDMGPQAALKVNEVKAALIKLGVTPKIDIPPAMVERAVETQLRLATSLYRDKKWDDAAREYLRVINAYPSAEASLRSMGPLLDAYSESGDTLAVQAVSEYLADRYTNSVSAANALINAGRWYVEKSNDAMYTFVYDQFLRGFPRHEKAGLVAFNVALMKRRASRDDEARDYFALVVSNYTKDTYYPKALNAMAMIDYRLSNFVAAAEVFKKVVADTVPGPDRAEGQLRLADCYYRSRQYAQAAAEFETLVGWLSPKPNPYSPPGDKEAEKSNAQRLEQAMLMVGDSHARVTEPPEAVEAARQNALASLDRMAKAYPADRRMMAKSLNGRARVLLAMGKTEDASKIFEELAQKYPESEEGKDSLATLVRSALEVKKFEVARGAMDKMLAEAGTGRYRPGQFLTIAQLFLDNGYPAEAAKVFEQVLKLDSAKERKFQEAALFGAAQGQFQDKKFEAAVAHLVKLLADYKTTGYFFDAQMMLGSAYVELGQYAKANEGLTSIFTQSKDMAQIAQAQMALAKAQIAQKQLQSALGSYFRVFSPNDPGNEKLRPLILESGQAAIQVAQQMGRWNTVRELCDEFEQKFPKYDKLGDIRRIKAEAVLKEAAGAPAAAPAGGAPAKT